MLLDIVILPPTGLRKRIGKKIRRATKNLPRIFVVDDTKFTPHLSLWHIKTSKNRIGTITEELKKITKTQRPIKIKTKKFIASKKDKGGIGFKINSRKSLTSLRNRVFKRTYPFKTGMMPPFQAYGIWTGKTLKEAKRYGRPLNFSPHFTMGLLKRADDASKVEKDMKNTKFNFLAKDIYICEVNKFWQVTKIIKRIRFG